MSQPVGHRNWNLCTTVSLFIVTLLCGIPIGFAAESAAPSSSAQKQKSQPTGAGDIQKRGVPLKPQPEVMAPPPSGMAPPPNVVPAVVPWSALSPTQGPSGTTVQLYFCGVSYLPMHQGYDRERLIISVRGIVLATREGRLPPCPSGGVRVPLLSVPISGIPGPVEIRADMWAISDGVGGCYPYCELIYASSSPVFTITAAPGTAPNPGSGSTTPPPGQPAPQPIAGTPGVPTPDPGTGSTPPLPGQPAPQPVAGTPGVPTPNPGTGPTSPPPGQPSQPIAGTPGPSTPNPSSGSPTPLPGQPSQPLSTACHPVINEVLTGTSALPTEEFVELFNPCPTAISLDGWRLVYRSATSVAAVNGGDTVLLFILQGDVLQPGGLRVYSGPGYRGPSNGALLSGIPEGIGAVGLRDRDLRLMDSIAFGPVVAGNVFMEGVMPAPPPSLSPSPILSLSRVPNGVDTNNNGSDFKVTPPTPMAANALVGVAGTPGTPTPNPGTGPTSPPPGQPSQPIAGTPGPSTPNPSSGSPTPLPGQPSQPLSTACHPVINEVLGGTTGDFTEEFVELFNPCATAFTLDGWSLRSRGALTGVISYNYSLLSHLNGVLPPGGYRVYGGPGYRGPSNGALLSGIPEFGPFIILEDRDSRLIDSTGSSSSLSSPSTLLAETPIPAPPLSSSPGRSLSRVPNGIDTNNNGSDFKVTSPTPMAANTLAGVAGTPGAPIPAPGSSPTTPLPGQPSQPVAGTPGPSTPTPGTSPITPLPGPIPLSAPGVTLSSMQGPSGTRVQVSACGFRYVGLPSRPDFLISVDGAVKARSGASPHCATSPSSSGFGPGMPVPAQTITIKGQPGTTHTVRVEVRPPNGPVETGAATFAITSGARKPK